MDIQKALEEINVLVKDVTDYDDSTSIGQPRLGKGTEAATDLFFSYASGRAGIQAARIAGETLHSRYTTEKAFKYAAGGGKYAGELRKYREAQSIKRLRKTIASHQKTISEHKEYIKNPKLKYQNWDRMPQKWKDNAIHHWQEDIQRAKIYETFAKPALNENMPNTEPHIQIVPPVAGAIGKYAKSDSSKKPHDFEQNNAPNPPKP